MTKELSRRYISSKNLLNLGITFLLVALILLVYVRFVKTRNSFFEMREVDQMELSTVDNESLKYSDIASKKGETFILILEISNCPSCIAKGFEEVQSLKKVGKQTSVIVVYDWVDEWRNWTKNYDFEPIYMLKRESYQRSIFSPYLPVLIKLDKGKLKNYRYVQ
jgi:hypothetical protein